ncbi:MULTISPECIES: Smr/MutS family protein [Marinicauda]|uniref:DNA mismatch repair protein MutS n=2 Tax=Alphaproteobacteria TaxID=28211 RepID=A0A4S2HA77_9PROT|nr:DNA mismatch repair protein MutS [Marinicauda pacifica]
MSRRDRGRGLNPDDESVWRSVTRTVRPLEGRTAPPEINSVQGPAERPAPTGVSRQAFAQFIDQGPPHEAPRRPAERGNEKRVRRGRIEVEARIDLHGMTEASARRSLLSFLRRSRDEGCRTVLVITGKGAGQRALDARRFQAWTPDERKLPGVLRRSFTGWLGESAFASIVSGYASAAPRHGGSGAFYVMLRRP